MLMEAPDGAIEVREITPGVTVYVPGFWVHRSINIGREPLVMTWAYPADAGQDYGIIARSNGMAVRVVADGTGWRAVPNPEYRPRTSAEIRRDSRNARLTMFDEIAPYDMIPSDSLQVAFRVTAASRAAMTKPGAMVRKMTVPSGVQADFLVHRGHDRPIFHHAGLSRVGAASWLGDVAIRGIDLIPHDSPERYRAVVDFLKSDPLSLGALSRRTSSISLPLRTTSLT